MIVMKRIIEMTEMAYGGVGNWDVWLSIMARGWGFPRATMSVTPINFHIGNKRKKEPKELPSHSIHCLLTAYNHQLEKYISDRPGDG